MFPYRDLLNAFYLRLDEMAVGWPLRASGAIWSEAWLEALRVVYLRFLVLALALGAYWIWLLADPAKGNELWHQERGWLGTGLWGVWWLLSWLGDGMLLASAMGWALLWVVAIQRQEFGAAISDAIPQALSASNPDETEEEGKSHPAIHVPWERFADHPKWVAWQTIWQTEGLPLLVGLLGLLLGVLPWVGPILAFGIISWLLGRAMLNLEGKAPTLPQPAPPVLEWDAPSTSVDARGATGFFTPQHTGWLWEPIAVGWPVLAWAIVPVVGWLTLPAMAILVLLGRQVEWDETPS